MTNPPNDVELLQQFCFQYVNKSVRHHFRDLDDIDEAELTTTNSRHVAKLISLHKDNDPITLTVARLLCFYFSMGDFDNNSAGLEDTEKYIPVKLRQHQPKIKLFFLEDINDVEPGYSRLDGTISFRLMSETSETLSKTDLERYGNKIKSLFGGSGFIWKKGKTMYTYADWEKGYQLQLLCRNIGDAKTLVEKTLDIQNHVPDWKNLYIGESAEPAEKYPTIPSHKTILGKQVKDSRSRPICEVRFKEAMIKIPGLKNLICLYDRTGYRRNPVIHN
jgi:hypothetical protein